MGRRKHQQIATKGGALPRLETADERRWSFALESAGVGVWDSDLVTGRCYYSPIWKRMLGYEDSEIGDEGDLWLRLVHPDDRDRAVEIGKAHEAGLAPTIESEFRLRHKDGHWIWVLDRGKVIERDAQGRPTRMIGAQTDITGQKQAERQLALLNERNRLAVQAGGIGLWQWDIETHVLSWDERMHELFEVDPSSFEGSMDAWAACLHPDDRDAAIATFQAMMTSGEVYDTVFRIVRPSGDVRHIRALARLVRGVDMAPIVVGTNWDVTEQVLAAEALKAEKERLRITLQSIGDAVICTDVEGRVTFMNPAAERLTQHSAAASLSQPLGSVYAPVHEETGEEIGFSALQAMALGESVECDPSAVIKRADGTARSIRGVASPVVAPGGEIVGSVIAVQDVTSARALQRELEYAASHDTLTGLRSRVAFETALADTILRAISGKGRHALLYADLDRFKIVNDIAGHAAGDALLKSVARILLGSVRPNDLVARLGGDEFAILLFDRTADEAEQVAGKILSALGSERFRWAGKQHDVGASIGIAPIGPDTGPAESVLAHADIACYSAKAAGRNQVAVYRNNEGDAQRHLADLRIASGIREAVEQDRFLLYAQEIRDLRSPLARGRHVEILTRMTGPDGAIVSPGAFIPAAERFDLMGALDKWVLRQVIRNYGPRIVAIPDLTVAVNLSANSLSDPGLWPFLAAELDKGKFEPSRLTLEITETAVINNFGAAERFVADARRIGCRISLDDFGSGVSSFAYLKRFEVDSIKIDGSFVKAMADSRYDRTIVRLITEIARELGVATIAEWIEDVRTVEDLRAFGVKFGQGYLFHRPRPFDEVLAERGALPLLSKAS